MLYLSYIYKVGNSKSGDSIYEMVFTEDITDVIGDGWEDSPAFSNAEMPNQVYINKKKRIEAEINLICITDEEKEDIVFPFSMVDALDGVVALAWEEEGSDRYGRMVLRFGEKYERVEEMFSKRNINLK